MNAEERKISADCDREFMRKLLQERNAARDFADKLQEYAQHRAGCQRFYTECTCGLEELLHASTPS